MLSHTLAFSPEQDEAFFAATPASPAVFLLRGEGEPYVSKTANLRRRLQRLLGSTTERSKRLNLRDRVCAIEFTPTGSDFESQFLLYRLLRETIPKTYSTRLRIRLAPLVRLHLENAYPRASVTTRLGRLEGSNRYYGPFLSRTAAEKFASDSLDFFKMRRCIDDLHPDPAFPGCVYSEMKMCLAPCFKGCTDSDYQAEVARVQAFFDTAGDSLYRELAEQRDRASAELAFEDAAAIHAKLDKLKPVLAQLPEIVRRIDRLDGVIVQPSLIPDSVSLFRLWKGVLHAPAVVPLRLHGSISTESRVEEWIASFSSQKIKSSLERMEHLAILKRWYYRSHRTGEIFLADDSGSWPLRQIVRGIGRVYRGEKPQEAPIFSVPETTPPPSQSA